MCFLKAGGRCFYFLRGQKKIVKEISSLRVWSMFIPDCVQMKSYPRSNAGTPQFQNLSGSVMSCVTGGRQGSGRRSSGGGGATNDRSSATSITFGAGNKLCNNSSSRYGYCAFFLKKNRSRSSPLIMKSIFWTGDEYHQAFTSQG